MIASMLIDATRVWRMASSVTRITSHVTTSGSGLQEGGAVAQL